MLNLSNRLLKIAKTVKPCNCVADIGTDHGYVPIYLCKNNVVKTAVAGDVSKGSALKAEENVRANGLSDRISVRCGNGVKIIQDSDGVECLVIAGMGGMLMIDILEGRDIPALKQLVLQPQKDLSRVRREVHKMGFCIEDEQMLIEDGKYYNIISAIKGEEQPYSPLEYELGRILLENRNQVLKQQLNYEIGKLERILPKVDELRKAEIIAQLDIYREGMKCL